MLQGLLVAEGCKIGRRHVKTLMQRMGMRRSIAVRAQPSPSPAADLPYLLRTLTVTRPNHVWAADITYIPMARGFVYLVVVMDWASGKCSAGGFRRRSRDDFCVAALEEALDRYGQPEIFNTDQGSQFTSRIHGVLVDNGIAISMDGKGAWRDNVFVERLWRSIKYEEVYLKAYDSVGQARASLECYLNFYNRTRTLTVARPIVPTSCEPTTIVGCITFFTTYSPIWRSISVPTRVENR